MTEQEVMNNDEVQEMLYEKGAIATKTTGGKRLTDKEIKSLMDAVSPNELADQTLLG